MRIWTFGRNGIKNMRYLGASQAQRLLAVRLFPGLFHVPPPSSLSLSTTDSCPFMKNRIRFALLLAPACLLHAWAVPTVDVVMEDNYRLPRKKIVSFGKQGLVIRHPSVRQNVSILPSEIRAVYFTDTLPLPTCGPGTRFSSPQDTGTSFRAISLPSRLTK